MYKLHWATSIVLSTLLFSGFSVAHATSASVETPTIPSSGDADDPAVWLNPTDASKSLIITSVKNAGLRVYDLAGNQIQSYLPGKIGGQSSRLNNVDVQYNFKMADGSRADLAIFSERGQDGLRVFKIDGSNATSPLTEITSFNRTFPNIPVANQSTAYGLGLWRDAANDKLYSLVAQRGGSGANGYEKGHSIAQFEMIANADGTVTSQLVNSWSLPTTYKGVDLLAGGLDSTGVVYNPQSEGLVIDQQTGIAYVGQEDVGIWGIDLKSGVLSGAPLVETKNFNVNSPITPDVEGLTIRYGENGEGVIIASSQGDSTFAAFNRKDFSYLGSFSITSNGTIDGVQHSDGADVTSFGLPGYEDGIFITQDGEDNGVASGSTNFKYVKWSDIVAANPFLAPYATTPVGFDPRNISTLAVPEPEAYAMLLVGVGLLGMRRRKA